MSETKWFEEVCGASLIHKFEYEGEIYKTASKFQEIMMMNSKAYGKLLVLDGQIQSSIKDEFIYHETLVHAAMLSHPCPKRVFIGGGGEGGTSREVLRHKSVESLTMVDIDGDVVELSKKELAYMHQGSFDDPRHTVVIDDAKAALERAEDGSLDVILMDLADPLDYGPCYKLYSSEFYELCCRKLAPNGVYATQSGPASCHSVSECFTAIKNTIANAPFSHVYGYSTHIPSFTNVWGFVLAIKGGDVAEGALPCNNIANVEPDVVDGLLAARGVDVAALRHYDGVTHRRMFALPKWVRTAMAKETRVICEASPIFYSFADAQTEGADGTA